MTTITTLKLNCLPCEICASPAECPVVSYWDMHLLKKIRICSEGCLESLRVAEKNLGFFRERYEEEVSKMKAADGTS